MESEVNLSADKIKAVHQLWDKLSDYPASESHAAVYYLLDILGGLLDSSRFFWMAAVQVEESEFGDPAMGWRPFRVMMQQDGVQSILSKPKDFSKYMSPQNVSESSIKHVKQAGEFRSTLLCDHVSPAYFTSERYQTEYTGFGQQDSIFIVTPITKDVEIYLCFYRAMNKEMFSKSDLELASYALRALKWFHRQVLLSFGMVIAGEPLTETQRKVLTLLLTKKKEQEIADTLGQKKSTTHEHVTQIYRKFNVSSRAALMAIWLTPFN